LHIPPDWRDVFGRSAPLAVEIGFGNGEYLARMANEWPGWDFIGFDVTLTCVENAARRLERSGVGNVRLARLDARFGLRELFAEDSVGMVYANFPCPWPKARHAHRRLFRPEFVQTLAAVLEENREVRLVTDVDWYAREAGEALEQQGLFTVIGLRTADDNGPATRYERKWRLEGRQIWELVARCRARATVCRISEGRMPHAIVHRHVSWTEVDELAGCKESWSDGAFVVREVFHGADGKSALLRVFSTDGEFQQHYFLLVARAHYGMLVKLDGTALPFRTPAVRRSVAEVATLLHKGGC